MTKAPRRGTRNSKKSEYLYGNKGEEGYDAMATPSEKLAESLEALHKLQEQGMVVIRSADLTRIHREHHRGYLKTQQSI